MKWSQKQVPDGIDPEEAQDTIESIARSKAAKHRKIAHLGVEDICQEVRLKLWLSLEKFDPERKVKLRTFLTVVAENRIRDIKRTLLYKHNKPCFRCPFWDKVASKTGKHDCLEFENKMTCEKYARHEGFVQAKISANNPISLDDTRLNEEGNCFSEATFDILEHIYIYLPSAFHPLFDKLKVSNYDFDALKSKERVILLDALKEVLEDYNS
ncbi:hypothetical protein KAR91_50130 [Candidatus Pacearchaeota archaeon]|nr:hypothetical protein [Candidatus Pacearchaeota archaeon]